MLVGPATVQHLTDALAARERPLPPDLVARADGIWAAMVGTDATFAR